MNDLATSVNRALKDGQNIETSSFYKNYQKFSKEYDLLIREGVTQRRESQLKSVVEQSKMFPFSYNTVKQSISTTSYPKDGGFLFQVKLKDS
jgi:hypothetical protein